VNDDARGLAGQRRRALALSWVAYATYYLGRKGFSAIKKPMQSELGLGSGSLGAIDTAFLSAYALGQFVSGVAGDRLGSRRLVGYGMLGSAAACAAFGFSGGFLAFAVCFFLNGLAQSTGWPGTTRVVAEWTPPAKRGRVMGVWSTCYQVGGLVATWLAGFLAMRFGWRSALFVPAGLLCVVGGLVLAALPSAPVALVADAGGELGPARSSVNVVRAAQRRVLASRTLWLLGTSYFFIKLIRYALLFWLPFYLATAQGYSTEKAANVSLAFDAGGMLGVIGIGRLADDFRRGKALLSALSVALLVPALGVYALFDRQGTLGNVLALAVLGALLFGPDSLLSGAAAQDAGGADAAATATGFVNGIGSFGAVLQGLIVPTIAERYGWTRLFPALAAFAACAVLALIPTALGARAPRPPPRA
jgi:sugar phosphate permease